MMKIKLTVGSSLLSTFLILIAINSSAYDNEVIHPKINEEATRLSENLNIRLKSLGYMKGIIDSLNIAPSKRLFEYFRDGGKQEDVPVERTLRHFHDPLKAWNSAGFKGEGLSSLLWAQDQSNFRGAYGGDWSWKKAREFYYSALISTSRQQRERGFADAFRALGQGMHLISDASVPAHVRNDAHVFPYEFSGIEVGSIWQTYESWAKRQMTGNVTGKLNFTGVRPASDIFDRAASNAAAPVPVSALWDTDTYTGANISLAVGFNIGLAEYTNANFFSEDTIFRDYPHPAYADTNYLDAINHPEQVDAEDGKFDNRVYIRKTVGDADTRLASFSYISYDCIKKGKYDYSPLVLDDNVYNDYAALLLPRAVGYSTALLDYFFRGDIRLGYETSGTPGFVFVNKTGERVEGDFTIYYDTAKDERYPVWVGKGYLEPTMDDKTNTFDFIPPANPKEPGKYIVVFKGKMGNEEGAVAGYVFARRLEITPPSQYIYSMVDGSATDPHFTRIRAKVKNPSTSEQMENGTVQAVAKYKADTNDTDFIYSVSASQAIDLSSKDPVEVEFNFDNDPVPLDATDLYLEVIFKGKIGTEDGAVAIGIKDISEPTPIDVFNDTDKSCVNGSWYSTADAIDQIDTNHNHIADEWDVNPHILQNIYVKISSTENPQNASPAVYDAVVPFLYPGEFKRVMYVLTDYNFTYSFYETWSAAPGYTDLWSHGDKVYTLNGTAVKNQTDYTSDPAACGKDPLCYYYYHPIYYSLRGHDMWWGGGIVFINWPYPADSSCQGY